MMVAGGMWLDCAANSLLTSELWVDLLGLTSMNHLGHC